MKKFVQVCDMPSLRKPHLLFALFVWSLLLLRFGYRFGTEDQVELLPYTLFLHNPTLYPHDFFIQGLNAAQPNERTVMATLLLPFVGHLEFFCLLFHLLSTLLLVLGMEQLSLRFIKDKYMAWIAVLLTLIPFNDFGLGSVEVYSECLQASSIAAAIVVWALLFFGDRKYLIASVLLAASTFLQLLDGLDVALVLSVLLLFRVWEGRAAWRTAFLFGGIYAFTAGIFLLLVLYQKAIPGNTDLSNKEIFRILFAFRHPHHFLFSSFSNIKIAIYTCFTLVALFYFHHRSQMLFRFTAVASAGLVLYIIATDVFHFVPIADFQFYKVTQWVKFFGVVALCALLNSFINFRKLRETIYPAEKILLSLGTIGAFAVLIFFHHLLPYTVAYELFGMKQQEDAIRICEAIRANTPTDAVFIQPFGTTELKFYGQRSSYVEFKANVRHKAYVGEWYRRIEQVYGVNDTLSVSGFQLRQAADKYFYHLSSKALRQLKADGVSYLLTKKEFPASQGQLILQNNSYAVYKL